MATVPNNTDTKVLHTVVPKENDVNMDCDIGEKKKSVEVKEKVLMTGAVTKRKRKCPAPKIPVKRMNIENEVDSSLCGGISNFMFFPLTDCIDRMSCDQASGNGFITFGFKNMTKKLYSGYATVVEYSKYDRNRKGFYMLVKFEDPYILMCLEKMEMLMERKVLHLYPSLSSQVVEKKDDMEATRNGLYYVKVNPETEDKEVYMYVHIPVKLSKKHNKYRMNLVARDGDSVFATKTTLWDNPTSIMSNFESKQILFSFKPMSVIYIEALHQSVCCASADVIYVKSK